MNEHRVINFMLRSFVVLVFLFILTPIIGSFVFSFNVDRFPSLPLGGFSLRWYEAIAADPQVWQAFNNSLVVGVVVSLVSTLLGFTAAYTDFRYHFFGKSVYMALALLPPTIPVVILGLAMLAFLSRIGLSGELYTVMICHIVMCSPFAMAVIRMRLAQMEPQLEAAAWNLGASQWQAMRYVILPFTAPSIFAALFVTMAVSFDEFAVAWFVSGLNETVPVRILNTLQGQVSPTINAIGTIVFITTITLTIVAQVLLMRRQKKPADRKNS
ncbi:binding-protein-dependent transport system inner membrane protein [Pseudomonas putida TRO1]|uniref:Polyamine ABC transporter permease n=3 Tax=Pseudomonas TaxID=286 RepID=A0AAP7KEZ1_9PSED|nr:MULTISPECIES: ABC transporter permease [Pseudomonas]ELM3787694.1 ABC transporter permease [Pseudomonas aeruginosa]ELM3811849.1 ABC transporter permease [Pseudomonas aeruginosa]ELS0927280.1 ABC transporter permease [Pseudomonas putida]ENY78040.1 binding-protein-dependent transport system inner membrane protein [Pseudomonas putida TRO1]OAH47920.1 polyamine ABC transporter permease [Pseudomonas monteilii]